MIYSYSGATKLSFLFLINASACFILGIKNLAKRVHVLCKSELENVELKKMFHVGDLKHVFQSLKQKMEMQDRRHFSDLVVPKYAAQVV